jgi:riboflavin transporter FmnP
MSASKTIANTRKLTVTAMLSAVAFLLMFLEFSVPMLIPSFVKMDLSDLPALIGAFSLGPVYGAVIELLKNILHIVFKGTTSAGIGELCNFTLGAAFTLSAGAVYLRWHTRRGAVAASLTGAVVMAAVSVPMNFFIVYPFYASVFGGMENIIAAYQAILPGVGSLLQCLLIFNAPFTLVKGLLDVVVCFFIYKPLSRVIQG